MHKRLFFMLLLGLVTAPLLAQTSSNAIDKFFANYVEDERFSVVYIGPKLFQMFSRLDQDVFDMDDAAEAKAIMEISKDLKGLRILSTDTTPTTFYKEAKAKVNTTEYEVLLTIRDKKGDNVDFLIKESSNIINELLLISGGKEKFMVMSFVGVLNLDKITQLAKEMEK